MTDYSILEEKTEQATERFNQISDSIKTAEKRMGEISELQKQIGNYRRTRDVYVQYQKSGYSKKFKAENDGALILHKAAKEAFNAIGLKTLPKIADLKQEYAALLARKKKHYSEYRDVKERMQELVTVKHNIDRLLNTSQGEKEIGKAR